MPFGLSDDFLFVKYKHDVKECAVGVVTKRFTDDMTALCEFHLKHMPS